MTERELVEAMGHLQAALLERGYAVARVRRDGDEVALTLGWPVKHVEWGAGGEMGFVRGARAMPNVREALFPFALRYPLERLRDVAALADEIRGDPTVSPYDALYPEPR